MRGWGDGDGKRGTSRQPTTPKSMNSHPHASSCPPRPTLSGIRDHQLGPVGLRPCLCLPTAPLSCCSTGAEEMEGKKEEEERKERSYRQASRCQLHSQVALHSWPLIICGLSALVENPASVRERERESLDPGKVQLVRLANVDETEMTGRLPVLLRRLLHPSPPPHPPTAVPLSLA